MMDKWIGVGWCWLVLVLRVRTVRRTDYGLHLQTMGTVPINVETSPSAPPMGGHWPHRTHKWPLCLPFCVRALAAKREQHAAHSFPLHFLSLTSSFNRSTVIVYHCIYHPCLETNTNTAWSETLSDPIKHPRLIPVIQSLSFSRVPYPSAAIRSSHYLSARDTRQGVKGRDKPKAWGKSRKLDLAPILPPSQNTPHHHPFF